MTMQLKSIPGAPSYYVDCEAYELYRFNGRDIKKLTTRGCSRAAVLHLNGHCIGTTPYRCAYATLHGIDITQLPGKYCISHDGQKLVVHTRSTLRQAATDAHRKKSEIDRNYLTLKRNWEMIDRYIKGDHTPLEAYLEELQEIVRTHYINVLAFSEERADLIAGEAINRYQAMIDRGDIDCHIRRRVFSFAKQVRFETQTSQWRDPINAIYPDGITL